MLINNRKVILFATLLLSIFLFACSDSKNIEELRTYLAKIRNAAKSHQNKVVIPTPQTPVSVMYQASVLRAPFAEQGSYATGKEPANTNPLQGFSLNMLRFTGTLSDGKSIAAYILAPDNKIYHVKVGDELGDHDGKVINIYRDHIEVMEESTDERGRTTRRIVTLQLKEQHE